MQRLKVALFGFGLRIILTPSNCRDRPSRIPERWMHRDMPAAGGAVTGVCDMSLLEIAHEVQRHLEESGRLSYQIPRREFSLNDDTLAAVVEELVDHQHVAVREDQALARSAAAVLSQARAE